MNVTYFCSVIELEELCQWLSCKESACNVEDPVQSLDWRDPLEKGMATQSSILTWRIPWTEEPGRLQSLGSQKVGRQNACRLSLGSV